MVYHALKAFITVLPDEEKPIWMVSLKMMNVLLDGVAVGIDPSLLDARLTSMVDGGMSNSIRILAGIMHFEWCAVNVDNIRS